MGYIRKCSLLIPLKQFRNIKMEIILTDERSSQDSVELSAFEQKTKDVTIDSCRDVEEIESEEDTTELQSFLWWKKTAIIVSASFFLQLFGVVLALLLM